jgi:hypothetical protein
MDQSVVKIALSVSFLNESISAYVDVPYEEI